MKQFFVRHIYSNSGILYYLLAFILFITIESCKKTDFLSGKPDQGLITPQTLEEFQSLLDNVGVMNGTVGSGVTPAFGEVGADNYYFHTSQPLPVYLALEQIYKWKDHIVSNIRFLDWDIPYRAIFYSNVVLDGLSTLDAASSKTDAYNNVKGSALFFRSLMFHQLAQVFAVPYDKATASADLGLPLKLLSDINERPSRATVKQTYDRIIADLQTAKNLLPSTPLYKTRPSKPAVSGLLARVYLSMNNYDSAWKYANECLGVYNTLIDFNDNSVVNFSGSPGIKQTYNAEIILYTNMLNAQISAIMPNASSTRVDSVLYNSYSNDDLRKQVFFSNANPVNTGNNFKGSYASSTNALFSGIAVDEVYLIRAECYARSGNVTEAMNDLNTLLLKRWKQGYFTPFTASSPAEALSKILIERRKELVFRGLRWTDLRRLNKLGANITLTRNFGGETFTLAPNDKRYTYLIPVEIMDFNPNWPQNPR